jgi:DNA (cytosine-5)-methyltransferase 1
MTEFELLLQKAGHTVPEAAKMLGYSEGHIYRWKRGEETPREGALNLLRMQVVARKAELSHTVFSFIDLFAMMGFSCNGLIE